MKSAKALLLDDHGAGVVEYALIIAVASILLAANLRPLDRGICNLMGRVDKLMGSASDASCAGTIGGGNGGGNGGNGGTPAGSGGGSGGPGGGGGGGGSSNGGGGGSGGPGGGSGGGGRP